MIDYNFYIVLIYLIAAVPLPISIRAIISSETLRVFNSFMQQSVNWETSIDIPFQAGKFLNSIKVLSTNRLPELQERTLHCSG